MKSKIAFFGSDDYSKIVYRALKADTRFETAKAPPPKTSAEKIIKQLKKFRPDIGVLASYGKILSTKILTTPRLGILNIHPSLLPKYRGPTPVPTAILNGNQQTGVSIIKMDEKIDHGPILAQLKIEIQPEDTSEDLLNHLFAAGAQVLITILPAYLDGRIKPKEQNHQQSTYTKKLNRGSGKIDWKKPDDYNYRFIKAMFPWPGTWTKVKTFKYNREKILRLKIHQARLEKGKLLIEKVQLEGRRPVTFKQFQEGYPKTKLIA